MSESDIYARLACVGIVRNPDGTITRDPTRYPRVPASPNAVSKDIIVNHLKSTWMRLYVPITAQNDGVASKKLPLVLHYHGGGFITQSVDFIYAHDFCILMARALEVVVASASYRLAPEFKLPAAYEDGVEAVEWLRKSEDSWIKSYADLSNVFLMGTNSGGNVAYNVGIKFIDRDLTPLRIRGLILHSPFFGGEERCESENSHVNVEHFPTTLSDSCWKLCLPDGADRDHKYSNPTVGDGPDNMEKIGRLGWKVMVTGSERERAMIDRQRDVANLMKEKGVDVVEHFTDGHVHGIIVLAFIKSIIYSSAP